MTRQKKTSFSNSFDVSLESLVVDRLIKKKKVQVHLSLHKETRAPISNQKGKVEEVMNKYSSYSDVNLRRGHVIITESYHMSQISTQYDHNNVIITPKLIFAFILLTCLLETELIM